MKYLSTRGNADLKDFTDIVIAGTAEDGGLYLPEFLPDINIEENLSYIDLATKVIYYFTNIDETILKQCLISAYKNFKNEIIPITKMDNELYLIKFFQGPTLSFKDYALSFLGKIVDHILSEKKIKKRIITATSGDTGPAAIYGFKDCKNISIKVLFPNQNVSKIQREQMMSIKQENVEVVPMDTSFDECQKIVKDTFTNDKSGELMTVNSINFGRIVAQVVYYIYIYQQLKGNSINFFVPTGNFGNICAGYIAKRLLKDDNIKLSICVGDNDTLYRFYNTGIYEPKSTIQTPANAIDISNPSNFERILYYLSDDKKDVNKYINEYQKNKKYQVNESFLNKFKKNFNVYKVESNEIAFAQKLSFDKYKQEICPHTAVALSASLNHNNGKGIIFATADPIKFK
jgi:threonine synthase